MRKCFIVRLVRASIIFVRLLPRGFRILILTILTPFALAKVVVVSPWRGSSEKGYRVAFRYENMSRGGNSI